MEQMREAVARAIITANWPSLSDNDVDEMLEGYLFDADAALSLMQPEIDRRVAEEKAKLLERLDAMPRTWELSWGEVSDEDGAPCAWCIHRRSGNRSDREWAQLAIGETPTQAMLTAFQQENSDGR